MNDFIFLNFPTILTKDARCFKEMIESAGKYKQGQVVLLPEDAIIIAFGDDRDRLRMYEKPIIIGKPQSL